MIDLTEDTRQRVRRLFAKNQWDEAEGILRKECGDNLPFIQTSKVSEAERIRFAVLKPSHGDVAELRKAVETAKRDWRDVLMAAGFGYDVTAHKKWKP